MMDLTDKVLEGMKKAFPKWQPDTRPIHTSGIAAIGTFRGTPAAPQFCKAEFLDAQWTPTIVRFSNSKGQVNPDAEADVRGMAAKFFPGASLSYKPELLGQTRRRADNYPVPVGQHGENDLIAVSTAMFMVKTVEDFLTFEKTGIEQPVKRRSMLENLRAMLKMQVPPPQFKGVTMSTDDAIAAWAQGYPPSHPFVADAAGYTYNWSPMEYKQIPAPPPASYGRLAYHAVHAFEAEGLCQNPAHTHHRDESCADTNRNMVRFHWDPLAGVRVSHATEFADDYLKQELQHRLDDAPIKFQLRMQIADPGDDTTDPTRPWPDNRRRVQMGTLELTHLLPDEMGEELTFNPSHVPAGIGLSDDPILQARNQIYIESQRRRKLARADQCPMSGATGAS